MTERLPYSNIILSIHLSLLPPELMAERYPHLLFRKHWDVSAEARYELGQCDAFVSAICDMPLRPEYHAQLLEVALIKGALATTAIEGNTLTEAEVERVLEGQSLPPSKEYQETEVKNVLDAMNVLLREVALEEMEQLIKPALLLRFHEMIGRGLGSHFDAVPGRFRTDERVVGSYRCPSYQDVPELVDRLCNWLREDFHYSRGQQPFADAVIEAIVAHVYVEWIHPFGDGNGRTGRLLEFYILLRAGNPDIASHILSNFYNATRPEYYRQLEMASRDRSLSAFIDYAVQGFRDGLQLTLQTLQQSQFATAWRGFVHDRFADRKYRKKTVFKRRRDLMLAIPLGGERTAEEIALINTRVARDYAQLSERTLRRDLAVLVEMELLLESDGRFCANADALRLQMARRLRRNRVGSK